MIWRAAWMVAVMILIVIGRSCLGPTHFVQIEFGMDPEYLAGAEVLIDGEVVGTLERRGSRTVNGFGVEEGDHTVEVRTEDCEGEPVRITSGVGGTTVRLMAVPEDSYRDERTVCVVRLEY